ncbi:MAG: diheme cytochrome c [Hydrogenophaga sp.]|uniref:diheme cytochrome c n=1 Tax=Hydrogenophaga sp. TaxID=1904254 RepID=UPI00274E4C73|nr:diheme cytochrome c [Hydrogenophaga sp.]MDP2416387.1 diheme cytochrome c [Hydrogenophaga sp.]MDZ4190253.1 diheme cytochrome c [Hydrogenophaga sp.]
MNALSSPRLANWLACGLLALAAPLAAHADSQNLQPRNELKVYTEECGSCHLAYPPALLPAASWKRMMGTLDNHYGDDASLDAATVQQISTWLQTHAGTYKKVRRDPTPPPDDRITRSAWFEREHRDVDTPKVWKHASVKSAANCMACHSTADKGNFDESSLRFPKGLDERYRSAFQGD